MKNAAAALALAAVLPLSAQAAPTATSAPQAVIHHRTIDVDGIQIFYREAGDPQRPTVLFLHGFPASSQMYAGLMARLADRYHVIAPDYPGSGHTVVGEKARFSPTFDGLAAAMEGFIQAKQLKRYALYMQDFGGPVGFRLAVAHPERVSALIVQNANAYEEGLSDKIRDNIQRTSVGINAETQPLLDGITSRGSVQFMYTFGQRAPETVSPDAWTLAAGELEGSFNRAVQQNLLTDYHRNLPQYPAWQAYLKRAQPPTLVVWGKHDPLFVEAGARAFTRDLPRAEVHLLDTGHFALEEDTPAVAEHMRRFLGALPQG
ncbi:alpha/beta hydrolase [Niveibacterium sp. SC-1]|uniref:alpha/beta fold hydrolase n=1 Tax=Niveibacterium sp. SC-1 TaxID=3135646 RepID=UPI00311DE172